MLLFLLICLVFIVGVVMTLSGVFSKSNEKLTQRGLLVIAIPLGIVIIITIFGSTIDLFKRQPTNEQLVGEYEIVDVTNLNIDRSSYHLYRLTLKADNSFTLTRTPHIDVCEVGKYEVDYSYEDNEIAFQCGGYYMAHIDKGFRNHRIEFVIGDPDSGQSIYFGKIGDH